MLYPVLCESYLLKFEVPLFCDRFGLVTGSFVVNINIILAYCKKSGQRTSHSSCKIIIIRFFIVNKFFGFFLYLITSLFEKK